MIGTIILSALLLGHAIWMLVAWAVRGQYVLVVVGGAFSAFYIADLIAIGQSRRIFLSISSGTVSVTPEAVADAWAYVSFTWFAFVVFVWLWRPRRPRAPKLEKAPVVRARVCTYLGLTVVTLYLTLAPVVEVGIGQALELRQAVFEGRFSALLGYYVLPALFVFGLYIAARVRGLLRVLVCVAALSCLIAVSLTGSRSGLLLSAVIPMLALIWVTTSDRRDDLSATVLRGIVIISVAALPLGANIYLAEVRDVTAEQGLWESVDLAQADALVGLLNTDDVPREFTYGSALTWFVPRSVWPEKPATGNAAASVALTPLRYELTGAETTAGLLGESYVNLRWLGPFSAALLMAALAKLCGALLSSESPSLWLLGLVELARGVNLLRGDAVNTVVPLGLVAALWVILFWRPRDRDGSNIAPATDAQWGIPFNLRRA